MWQIVALIANLAISYLFKPKPVAPKIPGHDLNSIPLASSDKPIPVVFGTVRLNEPNVVWYGDLSKKILKKKGGK